MAYLPINLGAYIAAYSGAIAGMGVSGWITSPTLANYTRVCQIAGAFAEAFDIVWNNAAPLNEMETAAIKHICNQELASRGPGPLEGSQFVDPANWSVPARACATLVLESDIYFASEGITPTPGYTDLYSIGGICTTGTGANIFGFTQAQLDAGGDQTPAFNLSFPGQVILRATFGPDGSIYALKTSPSPSQLLRIFPPFRTQSFPPLSVIAENDTIQNCTFDPTGQFWYNRVTTPALMRRISPNIGGWASDVAAAPNFSWGSAAVPLRSQSLVWDSVARLWAARYGSGLARFIPPNYQQQKIVFAASAITATEFLTAWGSGAVAGGYGVSTATETTAVWVAPCAGTISATFAFRPAGVAAADRPFTMRVNGADVALVTTILAAAQSGANYANSITLAAGDRVTFQADATDAAVFTLEALFTPTAVTGVVPDIQIAGANWSGAVAVAMDQNADLYTACYDLARVNILDAAGQVPNPVSQNPVPTRTLSATSFSPNDVCFDYARRLYSVSFDNGEILRFTAAQCAAGGVVVPDVRMNVLGVTNLNVFRIPPWRGPLR